MHISSLSKSPTHTMSKLNVDSLLIIEGIGVDGDAHAGKKVKHRSRVKADPNQPNLRQVHLIHQELLDELNGKGFEVSPGQMGENITTRNINLLGLPRGTQLNLGKEVVLEVTGLRNPCHQLDGIQAGLMKAVLGKDEDGKLVRRAGIMTIVLKGGEIRTGDKITVSYPPEPHIALDRV